MLHDILSRHLRIPEHRVRVINKDVGGSLRAQDPHLSRRDRDLRAGGDARPAGEVPRRPDRVVPDRHPRARPPGHRGGGGRSATAPSSPCGVDDLAPVGPFSMYPRSSVVESGQVAAHHARSATASATTRPRVASSSRTRRRCPSTARSAIPVAALVMEAHGRPGRARARARSRRGAAPQPVDRRRCTRTPRRPGSSSRSSRTRSRSTRCWSWPATAGSARERDRLRAAGRLPRARPLRVHRSHGARRRRPTGPAARASRRRTARRSGSSRPAS